MGDVRSLANVVGNYVPGERLVPQEMVLIRDSLNNRCWGLVRVIKVVIKARMKIEMLERASEQPRGARLDWLGRNTARVSVITGKFIESTSSQYLSH